MRSNRSRFGCRHSILVLLIALLLSFSSGRALAQTTAFTYQGRLTDGGTPANGNYDLQFTLWDSASGGSQIGSTQALPAVQVSSGVFTVTLDFGANAFPGANRFLEISARHSSDLSYTTLAPRQPITSTPYAVRSGRATIADTATNATQLGGVSAGQYVQTSDLRLTDFRAPTAGSGNYIQNTTNPQAGSNFNISGNGTTGGTLSATTVNAATQYNIGGNQVLSITGTSNTVAGLNAGEHNSGANNSFFGTSAGQNNIASFNSFFGNSAGLGNSSGTANSFFGYNAGRNTSTGDDNSFYGFNAGNANTTGANNSLFGFRAGLSNTTGFDNAFFGASAGVSNTTGINNSFFGRLAGSSNTNGNANTLAGTFAGEKNTTGDDNSFFGGSAGRANTTGKNNSFFGTGAGLDNITGNNNSFFGAFTGQSNSGGSDNTFLGVESNGAAGVTNVTAVGAYAWVTQSNSLVLGGINGVNFAIADTFVGIGTTAPAAKLHVSGGAILLDNNQGLFLRSTAGAQKRVLLADTSNTLHIGSGGGLGFDQIRFDLGTPGTVLTMLSNGSVGIGTTNPDQLLSVNGNASKVGGGSWQVFSDERLKNIKGQFKAGLQTLRQLQPLRYEYKPNNALGLRGEGEYVGFSAQAVQRVLPEAVNRTASGYLQINNDPILWTMLNAIKEQQQEIEQLKRQLHRSRGSARGHGSHSLRKANARGLRKQ